MWKFLHMLVMSLEMWIRYTIYTSLPTPNLSFLQAVHIVCRVICTSIILTWFRSRIHQCKFYDFEKRESDLMSVRLNVSMSKLYMNFLLRADNTIQLFVYFRLLARTYVTHHHAQRHAHWNSDGLGLTSANTHANNLRDRGICNNWACN